MAQELTLESIRAEMNAFFDAFDEFDYIAKERLVENGDQDRKDRIALFGIYMSSIKKR